MNRIIYLWLKVCVPHGIPWAVPNTMLLTIILNQGIKIINLCSRLYAIKVQAKAPFTFFSIQMYINRQDLIRDLTVEVPTSEFSIFSKNTAPCSFLFQSSQANFPSKLALRFSIQTSTYYWQNSIITYDTLSIQTFFSTFRS